MLLPVITRGCRANRVNSCSGVRVAPLCRSVMLPKLATSLAGAFTGARLQARAPTPPIKSGISSCCPIIENGDIIDNNYHLHIDPT